jgi:hypothetical protein
MQRLNLNLHDETMEALEDTVKQARLHGNTDENIGNIIRHAIAEYYLRHHDKHLPILFVWGGDRRKERVG